MPERRLLKTAQKNASSDRDAASVKANLKCGERLGITAFCENASERNDTFHDLNTNDETWVNIPDDVSELLVPGIHFDRKSHTHHL